ncbi:hypothetical protein KY310_00785 [Candidatus Woesearchaeota archaeon]|nr:hypothetical protein [Candidatus Woesearchaeota archaeon]
MAKKLACKKPVRKLSKTLVSEIGKNQKRLRIISTNFEFDDLSIDDLRRVVRASTALCSRVELHGEPDVKAERLYVTREADGALSYRYQYKHVDVPIEDKYPQSTLDRLARTYNIKV